MTKREELGPWPNGLPTNRKPCSYCGRTLPCIKAEDPYRVELREKQPKLPVEEVMWCQMCWDLRLE